LEKKGSSIIKIVDFGIAGLSVNLNSDNMDMGSLRYMAPEILLGKMKQAGPQLDIWAMGVILFALVYGDLPFGGDSP